MVLVRGKTTLEKLSSFEKSIIRYMVVTRSGAADIYVGIHKSTKDCTEELLAPVGECSSPQRIYLHIPQSDYL